ncbi:MAG: YciI family protein [Dehalococcoidia bacterium]
MLYMLMICYDPSVPADPAEQNLQPEHAKLENELRERGTFVSGAGLWPAETAKTVRLQDAKPVTMDGPFAETKEAVGGYYIVDCDEGEAIAIAARLPVESRARVQVRAIAPFHPNIERLRDVDGYVDPRLLRSSSQ